MYHELPSPEETITAESYQQPIYLSGEVERKRLFTGQGNRKIILFHDNVRPHKGTSAKATKDVNFSLDWEILPHAAYSPDMISLDYHLFRSL